MAGPLIVTADFATSDFAWLEGLRRAHYPAELNRVPAHLTMFQGLPPSAIAEVKEIGAKCKMMDTSFFLARQTLLASSRPGMAIWREKLFAWMLRNAESAMEFFKLPTNRVVELGSQVEI